MQTWFGVSQGSWVKNGSQNEMSLPYSENWCVDLDLTIVCIVTLYFTAFIKHASLEGLYEKLLMMQL